MSLALRGCLHDDDDDDTQRSFNRIAVFPVCSQIDATCDTDEETVAEIVAAGSDGLTLEKIEGLTVTADGNVLIVNDNDGVDDSNGETQLINLGPIAGQ